MADPLDLGVLDDVQFQSGRRVDAVVVSEGAILDGLARAYGGELQGLLEELARLSGRPPGERKRK